MSYNINGFKIGSLVAASDLSSKQFFLGKIDTDGKIALAGAGENVAGVIENSPVADEAVELHVNGVARVYAGAAVSIGDQLASDASGKAVTATTGDYMLGTAIEAASDDGELITILLEKQGISD